MKCKTLQWHQKDSQEDLQKDDLLQEEDRLQEEKRLHEEEQLQEKLEDQLEEKGQGVEDRFKQIIACMQAII